MADDENGDSGSSDTSSTDDSTSTDTSSSVNSGDSHDSGGWGDISGAAWDYSPPGDQAPADNWNYSQVNSGDTAESGGNPDTGQSATLGEGIGVSMPGMEGFTAEGQPMGAPDTSGVTPDNPTGDAGAAPIDLGDGRTLDPATGAITLNQTPDESRAGYNWQVSPPGVAADTALHTFSPTNVATHLPGTPPTTAEITAAQLAGFIKDNPALLGNQPPTTPGPTKPIPAVVTPPPPKTPAPAAVRTTVPPVVNPQVDALNARIKALEAAQVASNQQAQRTSTADTLLRTISSTPWGPGALAAINASLQEQGLPPIQTGADLGSQGLMPNSISPAMWDAFPDSAKQLLLMAWQARGGDPKDFIAGIEAQRPVGAAPPRSGRTVYAPLR